MSRGCSVIACLMVVVVSVCVVGQELEKDDAISQMVAYQARSENELGDYFVHAECILNSFPDSPQLYQVNYNYDFLEMKSSKLKWSRVIKTSKNENSDTRALNPSLVEINQRSRYEEECSLELVWNGNRIYRNLGFNQGSEGWVAVSEESSKSKCFFDSPLAWPFATHETLDERDEGDTQYPFHQRECIAAKQTKDGLESTWVSKSRSKTFVTFRDSVPVQFKILLFPGPKNNDEREMVVWTKVESSWSDFGKHKLPTKVTGVIDVANDPIIFETKFDWKLGKDIPEELVNQLKSIKASTEK
jgi:hypothetical protein